jgi:hypothetical protein
MRIGVSSSGRWWISGGPLFWLLYLLGVLVVLLFAAVWYLLSVPVRLCVLAYRAIAARRQSP